MGSSLNSTKSATDRSEQNVVHVLRKRITYLNDGTAITVGKLPIGAVVVGGGAQVITAFNDSGNDYIDIGTSDDADAFATDLDVSTVGFKEMDELATHNDYSDTAEVTVTATYDGSNSDMTAGVADIIVFYILK